MVDLASSSIQEATFALSEANLRVLEDEGFSASMAGPTGGIEGTPAGFSAGPFKVDLLQGSAGNSALLSHHPILFYSSAVVLPD